MESPYKNGYGLRYDDGDISLERIPYSHTSSDKDMYHTVLEDETIQNIAYHYYNDSGLWYIIADANNIYNPIVDIKPGMQLLIPNGRQ